MTSNRSDGRTDSPRDVAWCCQEHFKLNPSIFTDFHRYLPLYPTRYQAESPALNWNYNMGRHGLMAVSHKVWDKKLCHGSSSPGHLSPLAPGGITGHFAKTWVKRRSSIAPGAWMKACKVARCCTEKLFYNMLNLSASLETRSTRMIFHAKVSEALTKRGHWLFQQGPELSKRKWWWSRVSVKFLTEYPLSSTHTG